MFRKVLEVGAVVVLVTALLGGVGYIVAKDALGLGPAEVHAAGGQGGGRWSEGSGAGERLSEGEAALGGGYGGGRWSEGSGAGERLSDGEAALGGGNGRGNGGVGRGAGEGSNGESLRDQGLAPEPQVPVEEWVTIEGMVVGFEPELMVATAEGDLQVGLGPEWYRESQGTAITEGDKVVVTGFYEDGEFKASELRNATTGDLLTLRDKTGRPMWAGRGQRQGLSSKL